MRPLSVREERGQEAVSQLSKPDDFSHRKTFPGTVGGPFEYLVRSGEQIERIPSGLFLGLLLVITLAGSGFELRAGAVLWLFSLSDWAILASLRQFQVSYGPAKPGTFLLALMRLPAGFLPDPLWLAAQLLGSLLVLYGFGIEPQWLEVTEGSIHPKGLSLTRPLRVLQFGDLHMERPSRLSEELLDRITRLQPDLILFTGDVLSYSNVDDLDAWAAAHAFFEKLDSRLGVYAVPGSPPVDRLEILRSVYKGTKVRLLVDERVTLATGGVSIDLIGVQCTHRPYLDAPRLESLTRFACGDFKILLYHSPDLAPEAARLGVDVQLSGHTHGGQVRLPLVGAIYTSSLYGKRFEVGRHDLGPMVLYVSRGIGMEGASAPRVRFLCRPEITIWDIG